MAIITKEEVLKIAHMSRITLGENEIDAITKQLENVLAYAARVNEVATQEQAPLPQNVNIMREDEVIPFDADSIKAQAPDVEADYLVVPAILEHE